MHIALPIGKNDVLMGSDTPEFMGKHNENETRSKISIHADNKEEADKLFMVFHQAGKLKCRLPTAHGGSYFGMFRDNTVLNGW